LTQLILTGESVCEEVTLKWVPGEPSGPTRQVYYSTAYHPGGTFTLSVVYVGGEARYQLYRGNTRLGPPWFADKRMAVAHAEREVADVEVTN